MGADRGFLGHDSESIENAMSKCKKPRSNIVIRDLEHQINTNCVKMLLSELLRLLQHYPAVWHPQMSGIITTVNIF